VEDSSGRILHITYAQGGIPIILQATESASYTLWNKTLDLYNRTVTQTDDKGAVTENTYDYLGRLTVSVLTGGGIPYSTNRYGYTARGMTNHIDPLGKSTKYVYDASRRLLFQTNANSEVLAFTYNPADQLLTLTDGKAQQTKWNYDQYGRTTNKVDAANTVVFRYKYDANDRLTNRWTVAKGDTFYGYDAVGNLLSVDYPGSVMDIALLYDKLDRLTNVVDAIGTTKFSYTAGHQLAVEDGPWADDAVRYAYDGRLRSYAGVDQPGNTPWAQSYQHDGLGRLLSLVSPAGTFDYIYFGAYRSPDQILLPGSQTIVNDYWSDPVFRLAATSLGTANYHGYEMNARHERTKQTFRDGNYIDYTYDNIGQLKSAVGKESGGTVRLHEKFGYGYDAAWNLSTRTNNALIQNFSVDSRNQLSGTTRSGTLTVAGQAGDSDTAANSGVGISSVTVNGTGLSSGAATLYADGTWARAGASYTSGNNTYTATATDGFGRTSVDSVQVTLLNSGTTFYYDGNGNLTNDGLRRFDYDFENQLTNAYHAGQWRTDFRYDAFGRKRLQRDYAYVDGSGWVLTNETRYVYDGMLVVQERNFDNRPVISYTRGVDLSGSMQGAGGIGGLLARTDHTTAHPALANAFYHADGNGNVTALVNEQGAVVARYHYDPFGNLLGKAGPLADANRYRFSSKEWCQASGLYYYGFRFYEPNLQRWLNRDTLLENGGENMHSFVRNRVGYSIDPFGECGEGDSQKSGDDKLKDQQAENIKNKARDALLKGTQKGLGDRAAQPIAKYNPATGRGPLPAHPGLRLGGAIAGGVVSAGTTAAQAAPGLAIIVPLIGDRNAVMRALMEDGDFDTTFDKYQDTSKKANECVKKL
jgi:RHS repeat-associated protein